MDGALSHIKLLFTELSSTFGNKWLWLAVIILLSNVYATVM